MQHDRLYVSAIVIDIFVNDDEMCCLCFGSENVKRNELTDEYLS